MGGYSITRSPFFADRHSELSGQILNNLKELKALIGENSSQQALLSKIKTNSCEGLKLQGVSKATVDAYKPHGTHCAARPEYKQMMLLADQLKSDLSALTAAERGKVEVAKRSPSSANILVYSLVILSALLNALLIVFVLLSSKHLKDIV
jgi:CHASE3 domain sensor protein